VAFANIFTNITACRKNINRVDKMSIKNEKIAVLFGGVSQEREVSLNSGTAVTEALKSLGYDVEGIDTKFFPIEKLKEKGIQRVFNILHGEAVLWLAQQKLAH